MSRHGALADDLTQSSRIEGRNGASRPGSIRPPHGSRDADEPPMALALELARKGLGLTSPNPAVGAVLVKAGRIVGQGFHRRAGGPHAEIEALREAGRHAHGATLYVTLEPCNHVGRTPPCCDAILAAGVSRVVVGARDPNPITNGRGIARLRRAGVIVRTGILETQARAVIEPFAKAMTQRLPFVIAKVGQSLDGKIATVTGASRWITSPQARRLSHRWRSRVDAVLVGVNTVFRDDPQLTVRRVARQATHPIRVIVDSHLRIPASARCLAADPAPVLIATTVHAPAREAALTRRGAEVLVVPRKQGRVSLRALCRVLVNRGIRSVLIEGGGEVLASAFAEQLVDRIVWFVAPLIIGGRTAPSAVAGPGIRLLNQAIRLTGVHSTRVGRDLCIEGRVVYPRPRAGSGTRRVRRSRMFHPPASQF